MKKTYQTPLVSDQRIAGTAIMLSVSSNVQISITDQVRDAWMGR